MSNTQLRVRALPAIQYLRGFAATLVVLGHSMIELPKVAAFGDTTYTVSLNYGFGVDLFFVISGFIMMYTAGDGFGVPLQQRRFIFARLARIGPLYWMVTLAYLGVAWLAPAALNQVAIDSRTVAGSFLFLPFPNPLGVVLPLVAVGWTLNYEMLFYVIFTLAMFMQPTTGRWVVITVLVGLAIVGWLTEPTSPMLRFWTDSIVVEFAYGMMLGMSVERLRAMPNHVAWVLLALGAAAFILMHFVPIRPNTMPRMLVSGIPAAVIVAGAVLLDVRRRTPSAPLLGAVGNASYSIYLTHPFVVRGVRIAWNHMPFALPLWLFCPLVVTVAVIVGLVLAATIELPLHRWSKNRTRRLFPAPVTVQAVLS